MRENALRKLETRLVAEPNSIPLQIERAKLLAELGRSEEAKTAYLQTLTKDPTNFTVLNNLGALLHESGYRTAARTAYAEAVKHHPGEPMGHVNLANSLREIGNLEGARASFESALAQDESHAEAHQGLAYVLMEQGEEEAARRHRQMGFQDCAVKELPFYGSREPIRLLLLMSAMGGNTPIIPILDNRVFLTSVLFPEFFDLARQLPEHRLIFNAASDADLCTTAVEAATEIVARSSMPVINAPAAVAQSGRTPNAKRLAAIPGVITPRMCSLPRSAITAAELSRRGFEFPVLLRRPGFHTGRHFVRVDTQVEMQSALETVTGAELTVIEFLDARAGDGKVRKYRVVMVDGQLFPLHCAVSGDWKIHYFTAEMANNASHRAEDARFLDDMSQVLGTTAVAALEQINAMLGLEYAGVDFSLTSAGELIVFEANATMTIALPGPGPEWDYRREPLARVVDAVREMLVNRATQPTPTPS